MKEDQVVKTICTLVCLSLSTAAGAATFDDPEWPCIQRKVEDLSLGIMWPHPVSPAKLRDEYGLVIGHIGIVIVDGDERKLVHAASSDLAGWYEGGSVVEVPLLEYLSRVEKFNGVIVTRF